MDTARIARELLDALNHGATIPSVVDRNPGFGWDEGYEGLPGVTGLTLRFTD